MSYDINKIALLLNSLYPEKQEFESSKRRDRIQNEDRVKKLLEKEGGSSKGASISLTTRRDVFYANLWGVFLPNNDDLQLIISGPVLQSQFDSKMYWPSCLDQDPPTLLIYCKKNGEARIDSYSLYEYDLFKIPPFVEDVLKFKGKFGGTWNRCIEKFLEVLAEFHEASKAI